MSICFRRSYRRLSLSWRSGSKIKSRGFVIWRHASQTNVVVDFVDCYPRWSNEFDDSKISPPGIVYLFNEDLWEDPFSALLFGNCRRGSPGVFEGNASNKVSPVRHSLPSLMNWVFLDSIPVVCLVTERNGPALRGRVLAVHERPSVQRHAVPVLQLRPRNDLRGTLGRARPRWPLPEP